jgi:hypothetical protein
MENPESHSLKRRLGFNSVSRCAHGNEVALASAMTDRRLHPRSVFLAPASAQLRMTTDGEIESWRGERAVVITSCASTCGDELLVQVMTGNEMTCWTATVTACEPIVGQPVVRYRLNLALAPVHSTPAHREIAPVA